MKFSPSSSSTSFSANFCNSRGHTLGCFSGFLSRILCTKTPPTYPTDIENHQLFKQIESVVDGSGTPNVVARLMGLEFMPETSLKDDQKGLSSVFRSKSMDSGDFRGETEEMQGKHRRVKTSFSFKETENYFEVEDDDFFVLNFEEKSHKKKKGSNIGQAEMGVKHRRREKNRRRQRVNRDEQGKSRVFTDEERVNLKISPQVCQGCDNDIDVSRQSYHLSQFREKTSGGKEEENRVKLRKKKKKDCCLEDITKSEVKCELENSSPVSVLDDSEFISDPEVTASSFSEEDAKSRGSECDSKEQSSSSNATSNLDEKEEILINEDKKVGLKRRDYRKRENIEMLRRVCRLAEVEFNNSSWKYKRMFKAQDLQDIGLDFSHLIFDQLITELVYELVTI